MGVALLLASSCLLFGGAHAAAAAPTLIPVGSFAAPVYVTAPIGDTHRLFVVERAGRIQVLDDGVERQFLDIRSLVACCDGERGLLSMAFAPDYDTSRLFYVFYTALSPLGELTVAEYRRSTSDPDTADPASARVLLTIPHDQQSNHNGGQLQFGPDGNLYIGTGDGGAGGDPAGNGQNLTSSDPPVINSVNHNPLLGKLLRVDPRSGSPYAIPADNPFAAPAREVFAHGLRNPWRFSFDRETGDLTVADVGQDTFEEVDVAPAADAGAGANYGWNLYEGMGIYPGGQPAGPPFPGGFVFPVLEKVHSRDGFCAIAGGYVVRDPALPELDGQYVYGDFCKPGLRAATLAPTGATGDHSLNLSVSGLNSFGEDGCGRLYAVSLNGPVYRLATTGVCAGPLIPFTPPTLSVDDPTVSEGDSGTATATFHVRLASARASTVTVEYATADNTATAPDDYSRTSGTLTFTPGETNKSITVPVLGDTVDEPDETFFLDLSDAVNATIAERRGRGTIVDDDQAPSGQRPAVSVGNVRVKEGDRGTSQATFDVSLSTPSAAAVAVDYATVKGTATAPADYRPAAGRLVLPAGASAATVTVPVRGDILPERNETFALVLSNPSAHADTAGARGIATIVDDDPAVGAIRARRTAPLDVLLCPRRHHSRCRGIAFTTRFYARGRAIWRFAVNAGPTRAGLKLATLRTRVRRAGSSRTALRLRSRASAVRLRKLMLRRRLLTLHAALIFTTTTGRRQSRERSVRLTAPGWLASPGTLRTR